MKLRGGEGGAGEGQGFFGRLREASRFSELPDNQADQKARQHLLDQEQARNERIEARGVDPIKVEQHLASLRRLGEDKTTQEVARQLKTEDPDVKAAYVAWLTERTEQAAEVTPDNVISLDKHRPSGNPAEVEKVTLAD